ncbi:MAG: 50S ribosomal protein L10 [Chlamydiae bacterium]|nr:50S ribosomal protein L10 [Chlamydiota bacterium]
MRKEKTLLLDSLSDVVKDAKSLVLTSYDKMSANQAAGFRSSLREVGSQFTVVKKKMFLKAAEQLGYQFGEELAGHIGVVAVQDNVIEATKILYKFKKENENVLHILGGQFEGKICSSKEFEMISTLPTQSEMRAQFLSVLEAPMSHSLSVIEEYLKTLSEVADQNNEVVS